MPAWPMLHVGTDTVFLHIGGRQSAAGAAALLACGGMRGFSPHHHDHQPGQTPGYSTRPATAGSGGRGPPSPVDRKQQTYSDEDSTRNTGLWCWNPEGVPPIRAGRGGDGYPFCFRHVNPCHRHTLSKRDHRWHSSVSSAGNVAVPWGISSASKTGSIP